MRTHSFSTWWRPARSGSWLFRSVGVMLAVAMVAAVSMSTRSAHAMVVLSDLASTATINLPRAAPAGSGDPSMPTGLISATRFNPAARPAAHPAQDELDDVRRQSFFLGIDGQAARSIHDFDDNVVGEVEFLIDSGPNPGADFVQYRYDNHGAGTRTHPFTTVRGDYQLVGDEYANSTTNTNKLWMHIRVRNDSNRTVEYRLYKYVNLALTTIVSPPGAPRHDPNVDEKVVFLQHNEVLQSEFLVDNGATVSTGHDLIEIPEQPGDTNADFVVGADDLQNVLRDFTETQLPPGTLPGDFNGPDGRPDGTVGVDDLQEVLAFFTQVAREVPKFVDGNFRPDGQGFSLVDLIEGGGDLRTPIPSTSLPNIDPPGRQGGDELEFAFQWTITLDPGETFVISEHLEIVPEPTSFGMVGIGVGLMTLCRRRRRGA